MASANWSRSSKRTGDTSRWGTDRRFPRSGRQRVARVRRRATERATELPENRKHLWKALADTRRRGANFGDRDRELLDVDAKAPGEQHDLRLEHLVARHRQRAEPLGERALNALEPMGVGARIA